MPVPTGQTHVWPWPAGAAVMPGVERYWQFLQRQAEVNRQVALGWTAAVAAAVAVAPMPGAVLVQAPSVENPVAGHRTAEQAAERSPGDPAETVARTGRTADTAGRPPAGRIRGRRGQPRAGTPVEPPVLSDEPDRMRNDLFDGIVDGLIDADIKATL